jgi:hypothetical protein
MTILITVNKMHTCYVSLINAISKVFISYVVVSCTNIKLERLSVICLFDFSNFCEEGRSLPAKLLSGAPLWGRLLASPTDVRLGWKGFPGTNTLAY